MEKVENKNQNYEELIKEVRELREAIIKYSPKETLVRRFLLGIATGFGTVIGATVLVYIVVLILNQLTGIPVLDQVIEKIIDIVQRKS